MTGASGGESGRAGHQARVQGLSSRALYQGTTLVVPQKCISVFYPGVPSAKADSESERKHVSARLKSCPDTKLSELRSTRHLASHAMKRSFVSRAACYCLAILALLALAAIPARADEDCQKKLKWLEAPQPDHRRRQGN